MDEIQKIYIALFGRPADPLGLAFFAQATNNGADLTAIGDLASTPEYQDRFAGDSPADIITEIYNSLFGRNPELAGLAFFSNALANGTLTINNIAIAIAQSAQGADADAVANKVTAANAFTAAIDTPDEIAGYRGEAAAEQGRLFLDGVTSDDATIPTADEVAAAVEAAVEAGSATGGEFNLTPGQDFADTAVAFRNGPINPIESEFRFTAADERVIASSVTLGAGDLLADASTADNDRLNVTVAGVISGISGALVTNLETINLQLNSASGAFDLTSYTGVKTIDVNGSVVTTAGADQLAIVNFATSGVTTIDVSGATTTTNGVDAFIVTDALADQNITFTGHAGTDFVGLGDGDNTVNLGGGTNQAQLGNGNNTVTGGALGDAIQVGDGDNTINAGDGANVVQAGEGNNTITTGSGVDSVTVGGGNNTIVTGALNDTITVGAGNGANTITAGTGADSTTLNGGDNLFNIASGDTGVSASSSDLIVNFNVNGDDEIDFTDLAAGSATNYDEGLVGVDFDDALAVANASFTASLGVELYNLVDIGADSVLFADTNFDGTADLAVRLTGTNSATFDFNDIV